MHGTLRLTAAFIAVSLLVAPAVFAQGEHARRVAAELRVLAGDLRLLQAPNVPEHHATGLRKRILAAMAPLDILARLADQELGKTPVSRHAQIALMREHFSSNQVKEVQHVVIGMLDEYALLIPDIAITDTAEFAELHRSLCAACHDNPDLSVERPALNLSDQTATTPQLEMFARMLVGVRGDNLTGIDNPLSDRQILGLLALYDTK